MPKVIPLERARAELGVELRFSNAQLATISSAQCYPFTAQFSLFCSYCDGCLGQAWLSDKVEMAAAWSKLGCPLSSCEHYKLCESPTFLSFPLHVLPSLRPSAPCPQCQCGRWSAHLGLTTVSSGALQPGDWDAIWQLPQLQGLQPGPEAGGQEHGAGREKMFLFWFSFCGCLERTNYLSCPVLSFLGYQMGKMNSSEINHNLFF